MKPEDACKRKVRFTSQGAAQHRADYINRVEHRNNVKAYRCPCCSGWHLTSATVFVRS